LHSLLEINGFTSLSHEDAVLMAALPTSFLLIMFFIFISTATLCIRYKVYQTVSFHRWNGVIKPSRVLLLYTLW